MMTAHFNKLQTPLRAVEKYPTTEAQQRRFQSLGWPSVSVRNLWELWSAPEFASSAERKHLDSIEPFDEWEEFALFGCHYFLLIANTPCAFSKLESRNGQNEISATPILMDATYAEYPKGNGLRRFAASFASVGRAGTRPRDMIGNFGGMGLTTRLNCMFEQNFSLSFSACRVVHYKYSHNQ
jgi:tRNA wybutosine-synthesizing protein 4